VSHPRSEDVRRKPGVGPGCDPAVRGTGQI
jgi:hypothetical protein